MNETDERVKQMNAILTEMANLDSEVGTTKKQYILKLKDQIRPLLLSGYFPDRTLSDHCSLIGELLEKHNISYPRTKLPELFDDDEKRIQHRQNNVTSGEVMDSPPLEIAEGGIIGQLDFLEKQIGKSYDMMERYDPADKLVTLENIANKSVSHIKTFTKKLFTVNYFVAKFEQTFNSADEAEKIMKGLPKKQRDRLNSLIVKYNTDVLLITELESSLADITDQSIKEIQAKQIITSKEIDERNKLSTWEKITITLARLNGAISKNHCARLHGVDKKHLTNNIEPKSNPVSGVPNKHHSILERLWFKTMRVQCAKCNHVNIFDACSKIEEDLARDQLDLQSRPTVLVNAEVKG